MTSCTIAQAGRSIPPPTSKLQTGDRTHTRSQYLIPTFATSGSLSLLPHARSTAARRSPVAALVLAAGPSGPVNRRLPRRCHCHGEARRQLTVPATTVIRCYFKTRQRQGSLRCPAFARNHGQPCLVGALRLHHDLESAPHDHQVTGQRPVLHVVEIQSDALLPVQVGAPIDLP